MDTAFVYSILLKSCYKILFNTKTAMCSDTKPLLAYVKSELFFADNCCHSEIKLFILFFSMIIILFSYVCNHLKVEKKKKS